MSNAITNAVRDLLISPPSHKAVLLCLADRANAEGKCWPSIPAICRHTGLSRNTVFDAEVSLEEWKLIEVTRRKGQTNLYQFRLRQLEALNQSGRFTGATAVRARIPKNPGATTEPPPVQGLPCTSPATTPKASVHESNNNNHEGLAAPQAAVPGDPVLWQRVRKEVPEARDRWGQFRAAMRRSFSSHPELRGAALRLIAAGDVANGVALLVNNFEVDDFARCTEHLRKLDDADEAHHLAGELLDLCEAHPGVDALDCLLYVYEHSPCSNCRGRAVKALTDIGTAPAWVLAESALDAAPDTRALVSTEHATL